MTNPSHPAAAQTVTVAPAVEIPNFPLVHSTYFVSETQFTVPSTRHIPDLPRLVGEKGYSAAFYHIFQNGTLLVYAGHLQPLPEHSPLVQILKTLETLQTGTQTLLKRTPPPRVKSSQH